MAFTSQLLGAVLQVDGRANEGGIIEIVPGARLLLDVGVEGVEAGALLDDIAAAVAEAKAARDEAVDISGISTSDAVIASRITTPGTATEVALSATIARLSPRFNDGALLGLIPVADNVADFGEAGESNGTNTFGYARTIHKVLADSQDFRLVFINNKGVGPGSAPITVSAAVEPIATSASPANPSILHPVTFNGAASVVIAPNGMTLSDPIPLSAAKGYYLVVRTAVQVASGAKWPNGRVTYGSEGAVATTAATPGIMATSTPTAVTTSFSNVYAPFAIVGAPAFANGLPDTPRTMLGVGDSILKGLGDQEPHQGYFRRAMRAATGAWTHLDAAVTGTITPQFLAPSPRSQLMGSRWDYVYCQFGNNECAVLNLPDTQGNVISGWRALAARGQRVFTSTVLPRSTTTDGWQTTANQTPVSAFHAVRVPYNNWLRDGAPLNPTTFAPVAIGAAGLRAGQDGHPLVGWFELADTVESARDSGLWKGRQGRAFTATTTAGGGVINSPDAAFTSADLGQTIWVDNPSGADQFAVITNVRNATQVDAFAPSGFAATGTAASIGTVTSDGIHPTATGYQLMEATLRSYVNALLV